MSELMTNESEKMPEKSVEAYPFHGLRVLEITQPVAGPATGKLFADYGAQSIVIESRARLKNTASTYRPPTGQLAKRPSSFNLRPIENKFGTNKLSLTLNLTQPEAISIVKKLVAASDIFLHNFSRRTLSAWSLNYDDLVKIKSDIIMVTMPAMGEGGPYSDYRAWGWNLLALTGFNYLSALPGRPPICPCSIAFNDVSCNAFHTMIAVLAALYHRAKTGKGQLIELSQFESNVCVTGTAVFEYMVNGRVPEQMGNRLEYAAPHGVYRCQGDDRWCAIAVFNNEEWQALCRITGNEQMNRDKRFTTLLGRLQAADELDRLIEAWTIQRTGEEVMGLMQEAGIAAGVVQNFEDLLMNDPQLKERRHWVSIDHPEADKMIVEAWGFKFSTIPEQLWGRPPLLGEHNDYVLEKILQISEEEINQLIVKGVVD